MKYKIMLSAFFLIVGTAQSAVIEVTDSQLSQISGKGNGIVTPPLFPPKPTPGPKYPKYSTLNITPTSNFNKPLDGFDPDFVGIHVVNLAHNFGVQEDYRSYTIVGGDYLRGAVNITDSGNGKKYSVIGDVWRYSDSSNGTYTAANSTVIEEYYRVLDTDGTVSNQALRWSNWNRDINMTKW